MLHKSTLDLERSDTVTGRLDNVIDTSDIPEETELIAVCGITCVIKTVMPGFFHRFRILFIAEEKSYRTSAVFFGSSDTDLAGHTGRALISVRIDNSHVETRYRISHGTGSRQYPREVSAADNGCLGLTEALVDLAAGILQPLVIYFRVQGLTCRAAVLEVRKVVALEAFLDHETVHRRRSAEGRDLVVTDLL